MPKCYYKDGSTSHTYDGTINGHLILHKEDGPALISTNGDTEWYYNGSLHNINGPSAISHNGKSIIYNYHIFGYFLGKNLSNEEFEMLKNIKLKEITFK